SGAGAQGSTEGAYEAGGHRMVESERVADGNRDLTHRQSGGLSETRVRRVLGADSNDCQIGVRIVSDDIGSETLVLMGDHADLARAVHDVAVGEQQSVRREEEAGTAAPAFAS